MLGWQKVSYIFLLNVLHGRDVMLMVHGYQMGVRVRDVVSGKGQSNTTDAGMLLECLCDSLRDIHDVVRNRRWKIVKIRVVRLGYDQHMAVSNRVNIQKCQHTLVFVNKVARDLLFGNAAEQALVHFRYAPSEVAVLEVAVAETCLGLPYNKPPFRNTEYAT